MKLFSEQQVREACARHNITDIATATIGEMVLLSQDLEKETGIPFIRMDQGSPSLPPNRFGIEAEKAALDRGVASAYPAAAGVPEVKTAAAEFVKAFLDIEVPPRVCIPTTGSYQPLYQNPMFRSRGFLRQCCQDGFSTEPLPVVENVAPRAVYFTQNMLLGEKKDMDDILEALEKMISDGHKAD